MVAGGRTDEQARDGESGETLIELLVTIIMMGLAVVGILAGLITVARLADHNAKTTHVANSVQSYAEQLKQPVTAGVAGYTYDPCPAAYATSTPFSGPLPSGSYTASIKTIEYAASVPNGTGGAPTWSTGCGGSDLGLQRITLEVKVTSGTKTTTETVAVIKRNASCTYSSAYINSDQGPC